MSGPINLTQLRERAEAMTRAITTSAGLPAIRVYPATLFALIDAAEAAWHELPAEDDFAHCAHPNTRAALARFDFGDA